MTTDHPTFYAKRRRAGCAPLLLDDPQLALAVDASASAT
jgi:hypothetical protein